MIYQIYPRSYKDSNNDGIGDLPGIIEKLDYIASLNVDAVWISPFFTSPMKDFGYDISNYRTVDPIFGSLADFKRLLSKAHKLGLKVMVDQVISHSSIDHSWFTESASSCDNEKADWYVWADPKGGRESSSRMPPNNWLSFFGGSAWTWHEGRQQYYLHNFLSSQPDINFHSAAARQAQLDNLEFWLKLGVDGVRLDVVNFYYHHRDLHDNPICEKGLDEKVGVSELNPYAAQDHCYDITQPENIAFLKDLRQVLDRYPGRTSIGEINAENPLQVMSDYTSGSDKLHMAYTFDLLGKQASASYIRSVIERFENTVNDSWPCWALGNHDVERVASRWGSEHCPQRFPRLVAALLLSMRGSVCLYQGDELGFTEADVAFEDIVDPYGKTFWPEYKGRDGCRTPIAWDDSVSGGFSEVAPWLPLDNVHRLLSVKHQEEDTQSTLNFFRHFIAWRSEFVELLTGDITLFSEGEGSNENVVGWLRHSNDRKIVAVFNLSSEPCCYSIAFSSVLNLDAPGFSGLYRDGNIELNAYDAFFAEVTFA